LITKSSQIRIGLLYPIDFGITDKLYPALEILTNQLGLDIFYHFVYHLTLAYNASAYPYSYSDDSVIIIDLTVSTQNKELAIKEAGKLIKTLNFNHNRVENSKQRLIGQYILNNDTISDQLRIIAEEYHRQKKIFSLSQYLKKIQSVDSSSVNKIYQKYLNNIAPQKVFTNI